MRNLTLNDETQTQILGHLETTELLMRLSLDKVNKSGNRDAEIIALPDLGISANATRMSGGFFTGMAAVWDEEHPFVPVDATINSCGVSIYLLDADFSVEEFKKCLVRKDSIREKLNYIWNFDTGNHFVTLGSFPDGTRCVIAHSSAAEYKKGNLESGLYPEKGNWYWDSIEITTVGDRYLRFLSGSKAEDFIDIALSLPKYNEERHDKIIEFLFGRHVTNRYLFSTHYGMPTRNSLAIGCIWDSGPHPLLTTPTNDIFIVESDSSSQNYIEIGDSSYSLSPHGYGSMLNQGLEVSYVDYKLAIGGCLDSNFYYSGDYCGIRGMGADETENTRYANRILEICPGNIVNKISPMGSISKRGFMVMGERK